MHSSKALSPANKPLNLQRTGILQQAYLLQIFQRTGILQQTYLLQIFQRTQIFKQLQLSLFLTILCSILYCIPALAQTESNYDEISLSLDFRGLPATELEVVIQDKEVYLSVTALFNFLKIKNQYASSPDSVLGFFMNPKNIYLIDQSKNEVILQGKVYSFKPDDMVKTAADLYLKPIIFSKVFGLDCNFNFRDLTLNMSTQLDLPILQESRQEVLRKNIGKLNNEITADTTVKRKYQHFNLGTADWSVTSIQQPASKSSALLFLKLGGTVAGGETTLYLNYNTANKNPIRQQSYSWRYVNNENTILRQIIAGKVSPQSISSLTSSLIGVQLTNSSTLLKRSFGTYTLSDYTSPDWTVELYINNVLIDYKKADASGFYSFQVPMVYGNSAMQLRLFGPWGEESMQEKNISMPYNFVSKNETEYTLTAGMLEDGKQSRFSRLVIKHGLSNKVTIGSGIEYLSSVNPMPAMPFLNASYLAAPNLVLSGDYTINVMARGILNYRLSSDFLVEAQYIRYKEGQQAILTNYLEERKLILTKQFKLSNFYAFSRLSVNEVVYPTVKQTITDLLISASWRKFSTNITTYAIASSSQYLNMYSNLAFAFTLPKQYIIRPQAQYMYRTSQVTNLKIELEKQLFGQGFLNLTFENNFIYNVQNLSIGLRTDLSFMRTSFLARQTNKRITLSQTLTGGIIYDRETNYFKMNNRTNVGRGGLVLYPYLDVNRNNRRDKNEPKITGLKLNINGGNIQRNERDTTLQIVDLEPYTNHLLEIDPNSFENIAWRAKDLTYKITIEPNKLKRIEIPVYVMGEVSGMVYKPGLEEEGQDRILVNFYRNGSVLAGSIMTESNGYYTFLGLAPGSYTAKIDEVQLKKLNMKSAPKSVSFKIKANTEGDVVASIDFKLANF